MDPEMPETGSLRDAVAGLYEEFARYPLRTVVEGCPHCVTGHDDDLLRSRPLRELSWRELAKFGWKTMTTWGSVDDFRHFLPRILELVAIELDPALAPPDGPAGALYHWAYDFEPLFAKLGYGEWLTWPGDEREAIRAYLLALWRRLLASYPASSLCAETMLKCLYVIGEDPTAYLDAWRADTRLAALRHLALLAIHNDWMSGPAHIGAVQRWLWEPRTRAMLEDAFFAQADNPPIAEQFSRAVDHLAWSSPES
jgi:hypothetical protein